MCTDTDTATDSATNTFILIWPCSDLCRTVQVNGWVCLSFSSLLVPFVAILSCRWKSPCDPAMPEISKITKDETEQLIALVWENVALYDQSSDDYSTFSLKQTSSNGFKWTGAINDAGKGEGNEQPSVCINITKNERCSVCRYVPTVCTHKAFAGRRNACASSFVLIRYGVRYSVRQKLCVCTRLAY